MCQQISIIWYLQRLRGNTQTDRHTHTQTNYYNPPPTRLENAYIKWLLVIDIWYRKPMKFDIHEDHVLTAFHRHNISQGFNLSISHLLLENID